MSKYTIRLEEVCNYLYNNQESVLETKNFNNPWAGGFDTELENPFDDVPDVDTIISAVRTKIFDFDYPLPNNDETKKVELETKIIKHYYMHEIAFETWGRFKLALNERLNLIMPYYNELYVSQELATNDPLTNMEIIETRNIKNTNEGTSNSTNTSQGSERTVFQDTPTSQLGNTDYATSITERNAENEDTGNINTNSKGNEDMYRTLKGLYAYSKQDLIQRFRENIINIEESIVNELYDLFMLIY